MSMNRQALLIVPIALLLGAVRVEAASWTQPSLPVPGGNTSAFLNTSTDAQQKLGDLTVLKSVTVTDNAPAAIPNVGDGVLNIGRQGGSSKFCWNGVCRNNWDEGSSASGYLALSPAAADGGYVDLRQTGLGNQVAAETIRAVAGAPFSGVGAAGTYGLRGAASTNTAGSSTGIVGQATQNTSTQYAVYAYSANWSPAWAGYFIGDVAIVQGYDLSVGFGAPQNELPQVAELCLAGQCLDAWPAVAGNGLWAQSSGPTGVYAAPQQVSRNVTLVGSGAAAPASVTVAAGTANVTVTGSAEYDQYVVSTPTSFITPTESCGDGVCNNNECDDRLPVTYGQPQTCFAPNLCKPDCDVTPPDPSHAGECYIEQCFPSCPVVTYRLYSPWIRPDPTSNPDYAGTRVVIRTDYWPTKPTDLSTIPIPSNYPTPAYNIPALDCNRNLDYMVTAWAYDTSGNFSTGESWIAFCTNQPNVICPDPWAAGGGPGGVEPPPVTEFTPS